MTFLHQDRPLDTLAVAHWAAPATAPTSPITPVEARLLPLLAGMIGAGHGVELISYVLTISCEALFRLVIDNDLATPHSRPLRKTGGARVWTAPDYSILVQGWLGNFQTTAIAEKLGRSRGAVWAKARRLGFPRRKRRDLIQPDLVWIKPAGATRKEPIAPFLPPSPSLPETWPVAGSPTGLMMSWKRPGREVAWTYEAAREVGLRKFAGQRNAAIAAAFGVSLRTVTSLLYWLQVPPLSREAARDDFDPSVAEANISAMRYEERRSLTNPDRPYWRHKVRREACRLDRTFDRRCTI